jgi:hypothetical protein
MEETMNKKLDKILGGIIWFCAWFIFGAMIAGGVL